MAHSISQQQTTTGAFQKKARSPRVVKTSPKTSRNRSSSLNSKHRFAELSSKITPLLKPYVNRISVFGSYARGEATANSDIDLLIALKPAEARPVLGLFGFIKLEQELGKKLGCEVDLVTEEGLNPRRRTNIEKDSVVLYEKNDDIALLGDILDIVRRIESYTHGVSMETFLENFMMQDAVMHQLEIVGEASNSISDEFQDDHPSLPWMQMRAIRNKIVHDYRGINLHIIWDTAIKDLPALKAQVQKLLGE